jgi:hypothetical protein
MVYLYVDFGIRDFSPLIFRLSTFQLADLIFSSGLVIEYLRLIQLHQNTYLQLPAYQDSQILLNI